MKKRLAKSITIIIGEILVAVGIIGALLYFDGENSKFTATIEYSTDPMPAMVEDDQGEITHEEAIPTVEEVDGGMFEDEVTGVSATEGEYEDLGWAETYDVSSPTAFKNDTLGKCIRAGNRFGSQCVSLARVYWWSYADRDVSTCGTGMAKGMMNCAEQNAGDDFLIYWADSKDKIQAGDWLVFDGGQFGHVGMALGPLTNGYVTLLGENQGGTPCEGGGAATNMININIKNLIGYYRPKAYVKPEPKPEPTPTPAPSPEPKEDVCNKRAVKKGDTTGAIYKECVGEIKNWNDVYEYAKTWKSVEVKPGQIVYDGWNTGTGVGLYAGDVIERVAP